MNDDTHDDDDIIRKLRSALDEVANSPAEPLSDASRTGDDVRRGRWIAAAAALVLIGAATAVLGAHGGNEHAGTSPTASTPTTSDTHQSTVPPTTVGSYKVGWYTLELPWLTADVPQFQFCCPAMPAPGPMYSMAWGDTRGIEHGLLLLQVKRSATGGPDSLTYTSFGLTSARHDALVQKVVPGSGIPYVLSDPSMELLANGMVGLGNLVTETWRNGASGVTLSVGDYETQLDPLTRGSKWTTTTLAGSTAYRVDNGGGSTFIWKTPAGTWAVLQVDAGLSQRIDDILANLHPAPLPTPEPNAGTTTTVAAGTSDTYTARGITIIDSGKGPMIAFSLKDSLPPQGGDVPLSGFDWSMVNGEQTVNGTTWGGPYNVTGTWNGTVFTLTRPPVPATLEGATGPTHNTMTPGCTLETMKPMLDALSTLDYKSLGVLSTGSDNWDGHCGVYVNAMFDTPEVRAAAAKVGTDVVLTFAFERKPG